VTGACNIGECAYCWALRASCQQQTRRALPAAQQVARDNAVRSQHLEAAAILTSAPDCLPAILPLLQLFPVLTTPPTLTTASLHAPAHCSLVTCAALLVVTDSVAYPLLPAKRTARMAL
jgi:hypothetical protein